MKAVNSEFENNKNQDGWRFQTMMHIIANPNHPYSRFTIGNLKSLQDNPAQAEIDVRAQLLEFYAKFYSANLMKLVVLGKGMWNELSSIGNLFSFAENLDTLERIVTEIFSAIKNKNIVDTYPELNKFHPEFELTAANANLLSPNDFRLSQTYQPQKQVFTKDCIPAFYHIVPKGDLNILKIVWPLKTLQHEWKEKSTRYVSHLLGHESDGSLFALLKKNGWATQLVAGDFGSIADVSQFTCNISLTVDGLSMYI
jgi:insulysin